MVRARIERGLEEAGGLFAADSLQDVLRALDFARDAGLTVNLWRAQNLFQIRLAPRLGGLPPKIRTLVEQVADRLYFNLDALRAPDYSKEQ
jgi:hypothetical protein